MPKALIIAEKPSVAGDIARALGGFKKHSDYFENDDYVVSSAVGHLLELVEPEKFQVKRGKWTFKQLPVIPNHFDLKPIDKTASRLRLLTKLIKRKDVDTIVNACDAGREGELIFRYIAQHTKTKKPIKRLWLQSMTPAAIRKGFDQLRSDEEMLPLADAAVCRSEADWLVGINGSRAMTAFNSKTGGFHLTTVGRVQTPTLSIVVEREEEIKKFQPRDYWEVHGTFGAAKGDYPGRWFREEFDGKAEREKDPHARAERLWDKAQAEAIAAKCHGKPGVVEETSKPSKQAPPLLYDLTSLQREANSRFGFAASTTLKLAQALYERHKMLTYPRTDSRALPEDYHSTVREALGTLNGAPYGPFAGKILERDWVKPNKRIFNNAKISDHHAIIPTPGKPKKLNELEQKLYDMVVRRFLAVFYPAAQFKVTTRITRVEGEAFRTDGKVLVEPGWLEVYGKSAATEGDDKVLTEVAAGETVATQEIEIQDNVTKPPPRYTEATLLSAMEGAGKLVTDEELREAMSEKGLGTPATRASIIENLIRERYLYREQKELVPTAKAFSLVVLLRGLDVADLCKPELTGDWEYKLRQIQRGELSREEFMKQIASMTDRFVQKTKDFEHDTVPGDFGELTVPCPKCGSVIKETYKKFQCTKAECDFALWKIVAGRQFEPEEIEELLTKKVIGPLQGFRSKMGRPFAAAIRLGDDLSPTFDFGNDDGDDEGKEPVDFSAQEPLGKCPKCQANVYDNINTYVCEKAVGGEKTCKFRSGKIILQQPIEHDQMRKLLAAGRTDLLDKFVSKRGRKFKAFLVIDSECKVGFEFEKKEKRAAKKKTSEPAVKLDFAGQEPVGQCPRCKGKVFESDTQFLCERTQADAKKCKFKSGKEICGRKISREEMAQLLTDGRTSLLENFTSKYGKPFAAHLVVDDKGKTVFEFPEREEQSA